MSTMSVAGREVTVSRTGKTFYPGRDSSARPHDVTKGDVLEYYRAVAEVMVPHLRGRALTLRRFPDGITGEGWFQKDASEYFPDWLRIASVPQRGERDRDVHHVVGEDPAGLLYLANQATIEFHIWTSTVDNLEHPDRLVIDLDPPGSASIESLRAVTRRVRDLLDELGLAPHLQTTGGSGYHVVAPLDGGTDFENVRELAGEAAGYLAERDPHTLTTAHRIHKRGDRIFLDTNRNAYAQTFIAPYSLRAKPGATAATPLDWSELSRTSPGDYGISNVPRRLAHKADPWREMSRHAASAQAARERLDRMR